MQTQTEHQQTPHTGHEPIQPLMIGAMETARLLGIGKTTLYSMDADGQLGPRAHKYGRRSLWEVTELRAWTQAGSPCRQKWTAMRSRS